MSDPIRTLLELDRMVHEPARLAILTVLASAGSVEFKFMERDRQGGYRHPTFFRLREAKD